MLANSLKGSKAKYTYTDYVFVCEMLARAAYNGSNCGLVLAGRG